VIADLDRNNLLNDDNYLFNYNLYIRRKFLKNIITENDFKKEIQKKEKKRQKALNFKQIYQTFITVSNDIFHKLLNISSNQEFINSLSEIITFFNHINSQLIKIKKTYNCVTYQFSIEKEIIKHIKYKYDTPLKLTTQVFMTPDC
jgi:hypothetical protein